nr:phage terminase large subunit [Ensifer sp. ENS04]
MPSSAWTLPRGNARVSDLKLVDPLVAPKETLADSTTLHNEPKIHWRFATFNDPIKDDFRVFLTLLWRQLNLPDPTPLQLDVAYDLQHHGWSGEVDRRIIMAFRGAAKSWITAAYVLWNIHRNPQLKIGVVSGSGKRSVAFVQFCLTLIFEWDLLKYLSPGPKQRQSTTAFDVGPSFPDQTPSIWSAGITSQIVGFRADIIVGDDVETNTNSMTPDMREKLAERVKEFDSIIKPGGQIIFLGTPQTEASIYNVLKQKGYAIRIWPVRFPTGKQLRAYGDSLAPWVRWKLERQPSLIGKSVEPTRFSDEDLLGREISHGKATFALQFMLDTSMADVDKYPLRLRDVITMSLDRRIGPDAVSWGNAENLALKTVQAIALDGDRLYGPSSVSESFSKYSLIWAYIDPSGKGADETTLTIGGVLHSTAFILKQAGWQDGYGEKTLEDIANLLVSFRVRKCRIEDDFGQGMFAQLLRPVVKKKWDALNEKLAKGERGQTEIESEKSAKVQKELRILETLEPVFQAHRLVIAKEVFEEDYAQVQKRDGTDLRDRYSLMYQITRLTREKGCLTHDDRVEGLSGLVGMFKDHLGLHPADQAEAAEEARMAEALRKLGLEEDEIAGTRARSTILRGKLRSGRQRSARR